MAIEFQAQMRKFNSPYVYKNTAIQFTIVKFIGVEANLLCGGGYLQFYKKAICNIDWVLTL